METWQQNSMAESCASIFVEPIETHYKAVSAELNDAVVALIKYVLSFRVSVFIFTR
jgi:hypothetical protein